MGRKKKADCTPEEWEKIRLKKREQDRKYYEEHKEERAEYRRKYYEKHREHLLYISNKWNIEHRDRVLKCVKIYKENNKEKVRELNRKSYRKNIEKIKLKRKIWRINGKQTRERYYKNTKIPFEQYASRLTIDEDPISDKDGFLMVRDFHTKEYFYPTRRDVENRIGCINGQNRGEGHLYKDDESKLKCSIYRKRVSKRAGYRYNPARDPAWRDMILSRANGRCERCGKECDSLIAHHKVPVASCAMMAADIDNGMALCPECHKEVHSTDGCRLHELAAEKREAV